MTLFLWYLVAVFHLHPVCTVWVTGTPTNADYAAAGCGTVQAMLAPEYQRTDYPDGRIEYARIMNNELLCSITVSHDGPPTAYEIAASTCNAALLASHPGAAWSLVQTIVKDPPPAPACTLPPVDNTASLATHKEYQFLSGRLSWWGIQLSVDEWQNRHDESIRGAADAAGIPASLLKSMLAAETQFWPFWTGDAGEVGMLQLTWAGADTALRHNPALFARYCPAALHGSRCAAGYDLLAGWEKSRVQTELVNDLRLEGTPPAAYRQAAEQDYWVYAQIVRAYACYTLALYPSTPDLWTTTAVVYNAGTTCLSADGTICEQGKQYLERIK